MRFEAFALQTRNPSTRSAEIILAGSANDHLKARHRAEFLAITIRRARPISSRSRLAAAD
jgi:hypothetical protein